MGNTKTTFFPSTLCSVFRRLQNIYLKKVGTFSVPQDNQKQIGIWRDDGSIYTCTRPSRGSQLRSKTDGGTRILREDRAPPYHCPFRTQLQRRNQVRCFEILRPSFHLHRASDACSGTNRISVVAIGSYVYMIFGGAPHCCRVRPLFQGPRQQEILLEGGET